MRTLKLFLFICILLNFTNCIKYEETEKQPDLSEAIELNSNQRILSEINLKENIEFSYATTTIRVFSKKTQTNVLKVTLKTDQEGKMIPDNYLKKNSGKIITVLKKEMESYNNFDKIEINLISNGEELQKISRDI